VPDKSFVIIPHIKFHLFAQTMSSSLKTEERLAAAKKDYLEGHATSIVAAA
jgi:hypothetical protein